MIRKPVGESPEPRAWMPVASAPVVDCEYAGFTEPLGQKYRFHQWIVSMDDICPLNVFGYRTKIESVNELDWVRSVSNRLLQRRTQLEPLHFLKDYSHLYTRGIKFISYGKNEGLDTTECTLAGGKMQNFHDCVFGFPYTVQIQGIFFSRSR